MPMAIYLGFERSLGIALALSVILVVVSVLLLTLTKRLERGDGEYSLKVHLPHSHFCMNCLNDIISRNLRRDYVENRDRVLRGLTLHRSGREPDG